MCVRESQRKFDSFSVLNSDYVHQGHAHTHTPTHAFSWGMIGRLFSTDQLSSDLLQTHQGHACSHFLCLCACTVYLCELNNSARKELNKVKKICLLVLQLFINIEYKQHSRLFSSERLRNGASAKAAETAAVWLQKTPKAAQKFLILHKNDTSLDAV